MPTVIPVSVQPTAERTAEPSRFDLAMEGAARGAASSLAAGAALAAPFVPGGPILAGAVRGAAAGAASPVAGGGDLLEATRALQLQSQSFNLQYLQLQEALQRESREFTAVSNVMRVKHDAAKAAIGNIH
jgi:pyridoxal biosynthesis lyase PdxS